VQVIVRDNNVDQALRALKEERCQREGVFREMKLRRHFEKPSERKARERAEAIRRMRKVAASAWSARATDDRGPGATSACCDKPRDASPAAFRLEAGFSARSARQLLSRTGRSSRY
jgi:small subunit ribosomal protein S21